MLPLLSLACNFSPLTLGHEQDAMLREFQEEIARLKAQLAGRQQQCAGSAGLLRSGSPDKAALLGTAGSGGASGGSGGASVGASSSGAVEARAAAIRHSMRVELERQLKQAVSVEALAKARQAIEQQARWAGGTV